MCSAMSASSESGLGLEWVRMTRNQYRRLHLLKPSITVTVKVEGELTGNWHALQKIACPKHVQVSAALPHLDSGTLRHNDIMFCQWRHMQYHIYDMICNIISMKTYDIIDNPKFINIIWYGKLMTCPISNIILYFLLWYHGGFKYTQHHRILYTISYVISYESYVIAHFNIILIYDILL